jgi:hypothetical protein
MINHIFDFFLQQMMKINIVEPFFSSADMMRPKSAMFYLDKLQDISDEFASYIRRERNPKDQTISDFLLPCHRFSLEAITEIALNTRLGCLRPEIPKEVKTYMEAVDGIMKSFPEMIMNFPLWKYAPPRLSASFRRAEDFTNTATDFVKGNN